MIVSNIDMRSFMSHAKTSVKLPERGAVLVTGPNGAGKSSIIEAVSYALWGKTLRGASPWSTDAGVVRVWTDVANAERSKHKSKTSLGWAQSGGLPDEYETTTKAQEALEHLIGSHDVWKRTSVFSSADAAHFTLATDSERKRLLESILGLDRFDIALDACRTELKSAQLAHEDVTARLQAQAHRLELVATQFSASMRELADARQIGDPAQLEKQVAELRGMTTGCARDMAGGRQRLRELERASAQQEAVVAELERRLARLDESACPTCEQAISDASRAKWCGRIAKEQTKATDARKIASKDISEIEADVADLETEHTALATKLGQLEESLRAAVREADRLTRLTNEVQQMGQTLEKAKTSHAKTEQACASTATRVAIEEACSQVLGLKGVRAYVLGRSLSGLEAAANVWLAKIASADLRLTLQPYTEKKTGGVADAISLEVQGAGGGHGYRGASGGERRRIDVALLLALAETAQNVRGVEAGTMFFDEVFDALDVDGVGAVSSVLCELAQTRCVVVISHSEALIKELSSAQTITFPGAILGGAA